MKGFNKLLKIANQTSLNLLELPFDPYGHKWDLKDTPTLDDEGEYSCYAKCSKCGAIENTKESIQKCYEKNNR